MKKWFIGGAFYVRNRGKVIGYEALLYNNLTPYILGTESLTFFLRNIKLFCYYNEASIDNVEHIQNPMLHVGTSSERIEIIDVDWEYVPSNTNALVRRAYLEYS